jgi:hypothetical protein
MNLGVTRNYIFLGYIAYNQILTREKKDSYALITANETPLSNIKQVCQETKLMILDLKDYYETLILDVMDIKYDIILEIPWLEDHNLKIN